jgi:hypothetical protein
MLRRISFVFLLFFSLTAGATGINGLNYQTYAAGGAQPTYTQDADGNITNRTLLSSGTVSTVNYNWGSGGVLNSNRNEGVIVRFYGFINITTAGTYNFGGNADDGIRIKVNNVLVVNSWVDDGGSFRSGTISLGVGVIPIEVLYYENGGGALVNLQWYINNSWQIVDTTYLATTSTYFAPPPPQYSSGITQSQQASRTANTLLRQQQSGNEIDIEQIGDNNNITLRQGSSSTGKNRMQIYSSGDSNTLNLNQGYLTDGAVSANDSNNHYLYLHNSGNSNNITTRQTGGGHYNETTVSGNSNVINLQQTGSGSKTLFANINGGNNAVTATQQGTGQHYLDINLLGNGHTVNALQDGIGNHAATIKLNNTGGSSTVNMNQLGTTAQTYSIDQSCTNPAGCNTTITQGQ